MYPTVSSSCVFSVRLADSGSKEKVSSLKSSQLLYVDQPFAIASCLSHAVKHKSCSVVIPDVSQSDHSVVLETFQNVSKHPT